MQINIKFTFTVYEYIFYCPIWYIYNIIHTLVTLVSHLHNLSQLFYVIVVTSKNNQHNFEHVSSYQKNSQSNLVKPFLVLHGKVLTGFKQIIKNFAIFIGKRLCWSLFITKLQAYRPAILLKRDSKHSCFPVNIAKFLRTPILKNICERLLLNFIAPNGQMFALDT